MFDRVQKIDLLYGGKRHWFEVQRFETDKELEAALHKDGIHDFGKAIAYTDCYPATKDNKPNDECGRMYLLSKSVDTMAHEAVHMANGILARCGFNNLGLTTGKAPELEEDFCALVGQITSELYAQSKYF